MGEELAGVPGAGDGSQEQAGNSGASQGPIRLNIDLDQTIEGRALKAALGTQITAAQRRAEEAERLAAEERRRREQVEAQQNAVLGTIQQSDPEAYKLLVSEAARKATETEVEQLRRQVAEAEQRDAQTREAQKQYEEFWNGWNAYAVSADVDPNEPEFQNALQQAWNTGNGSFALNAIVNLAARKQAPAREPEPEPDFISPPSSIAPGPKRLNEAEKDRLYAELDDLLRNPSKNKAQIADLKRRLAQ